MEPPPEAIQRESRISLERLLTRLRKSFGDSVETPDWEGFEYRLGEFFPQLFPQLRHLYGHHYDFFFHLESLLDAMASMWLARPDSLKSLDGMRAADPGWFRSGRLVGAMAYVDLFAGDLAGLSTRIPYLKELGVSYLHLMPLYRTPNGDDDGGYAVSSYREVEPDLGTVQQLRELADELRQFGISLVLDFVFNHTSDEHDWARLALSGSEDHQAFFRMFPDRKEPDEYERTVRSIFPDEHPGCFTYQPKIKRWVWTTFHTYQWDLNYENPEVFIAMVEEMLFLANLGVDVLRLDAVPFLWKRKGTSCEGLPEAHRLIKAFNAVARICAPALAFKSEAIVAPDEIVTYIGTDECQVSYNPTLMVGLWEALATRDATLLRHAMEKRIDLPEGTAWVNYVRSHDDIGWGFDNGDARDVGIEPDPHRAFLNAFYTGRHEASFAEGELFQENPETGDARVCGTTASLCGLGRALALNDPDKIDLAVARILLLYGITFTIGGIPLIYLGDEIGMLNDNGYPADPEKDGDARWLHRPHFDWDKAERRADTATVEGRIYQGICQLVQIRQNNETIARGETQVVDPGNPHVFAYFRNGSEQSALCVANFTEREQELSAPRLRQLGLRKALVDIVSGHTVIATEKLVLQPLQFAVLLRQR